MGCSASRPSKPPPVELMKHDFFQSIIVVVGEDKTQFVVHTNLICKSSGFFRAAVKDEWKEDTDGTVTLPEVKSEVFGTYLGWLYTGHVDVLESRKNKYGKAFSNAKLKKAHTDLIDAYCLGDYLEDTKFRNAVVDEVKHAIEESNKLQIEPNVTYLWQHVRHNSKLAKMMIDYFATDFSLDNFEKEAGSFPADFVMEMARVSVRDYKMKHTDRRPTNRPKCWYHEHSTKKDKCKEHSQEDEERKGCGEDIEESEQQ